MRKNITYGYLDKRYSNTLRLLFFIPARKGYGMKQVKDKISKIITDKLLSYIKTKNYQTGINIVPLRMKKSEIYFSGMLFSSAQIDEIYSIKNNGMLCFMCNLDFSLSSPINFRIDYIEDIESKILSELLEELDIEYYLDKLIYE